MGTLNARSLTQALSQARNVGLVEEPFVVDGVAVTVRNLRPDEYDSIFKECQGLSEVEYLNAWQMAHVSRAICEINGVDFRDVTTVEVEEADPKRSNQTKLVKVEIHSWLHKNLLSGWTREAIYICYRKVTDVIEAGEKKAQQGVAFRVDDESAEDKYRRLMGELKEVEGEIPDKMVDNILRENGLMRRATVDELESVQNRFAHMTPVEEPSVEEPPVEEPVFPTREEVSQQEVPKVESTKGPPSADRMAELLRNRTPLNQPVNPAVQADTVPQQPTVQPTAAVQPSNRTSDLAALEGGFENHPASTPSGAVNLQPQNAELQLGSQPRRDPNAVRQILDTPPAGGINPRFRPPTL